MSEALEKWPVPLIEKLLPRILEIIYEMNSRFIRLIVNKYPNDMDRLARMSLIEEGSEKKVRMAYIAVICSTHINGVAELHTELLKKGLFKDFYELQPEKFVNVTNGITPRRWLRKANPELSALISSKIGENWIKHLDKLKEFEQYAKEKDCQDKFLKVKQHNKEQLAEYILEHNGVTVNPHSIFDVQVKRLHEYKRQMLNILHAIALYLDIRDNPDMDFVPRTIMFGAKAAPGYFMAKLIIQFINAVANVINSDEEIGDKLKVLFLANYRVSLAEKIIPAADLSEQISLAGTEASGTGNMKFALNGALTIGTMDGANIEIHNAVGKDNIFIFGMTVEQVKELREKGYNSGEFINRSVKLKRVLDLIRSGLFSRDNPNRFKPLLENMNLDPYMVAADFESFYMKQQEVSRIFINRNLWAEKAILNVANMGFFSSDRSIKEYASKIWNLKPVSI